MAYPIFTKLGQTNNYQYPAELGSIEEQHYMIFTIKEDKPYIRKIGRTEEQIRTEGRRGEEGNVNPSSIRVNKTETVDSIALYIPKNGLKTSYAAEWGDVELGVFGKVAMDEIEKATENMQNFEAATSGVGPAGKYGSALKGTISSMVEKTTGVVNDMGAAQKAMLASQTGVGKSFIGKIANVDTAAAALSLGTRLAINPHLKTVFKGVNKFREHSFDFEFYPKSPAESKVVRDIITVFKKSMLPSTEGFARFKTDTETRSQVPVGGSLQADVNILSGRSKQTTPKHAGKSYFFKYPRDFSIDFFPANAKTPLYQIGRSVLTQLTVDYGASGGIPVFFKGTNAPVEIRLSLSFKETELLTREYITEGY
jgi:hypothetical protein